MEKIKSFLKDNWLNILILTIFSIIVLFVSSYHEHWSDEAQSWLISRDLSITEIISYTKYEGTPPLWCLLLNTLIRLGLDYNHFYLVPAILTIIGVGLVLFKTKLPWYIKTLLPFSYYIFFQSSLIARSYSLILPLGMLIFLNYKNRFDKPLLFTFLLFLFMNISLHTYVIAGSIYLLFIYDSINIIKKDKKYFKKLLVTNIIIFILFLLVFIMLLPNSNFGFGGNAFNYSITQILGEITFSSGSNKLIDYIACILTLMFFITILKNESIEYTVKGLVLILPVIIFLIFIHCMPHHFITVFYVLLAILLANIDKKETKIFLTLILLIQSIWGFKTVYYDINNTYDASPIAAEFIKEISNEDTTIYGINFHVVAIQPYFDSNIFDNYLADDNKNAFYSWKLNHNYLEDVSNNLPDICVIEISTSDDVTSAKFTTKAENNTKILLNNGYKCYSFYENGQYYKDRDSTKYNYLIFVSKDIEQNIDKSKYSEFTIPNEYYNN